MPVLGLVLHKLVGYFKYRFFVVVIAMAGASVPLCRKCLGFGAVGNWVSKVGPSTPRPPYSASEHPAAADKGEATTSAATIVVIVTAVLALVGILVIVIILRRKRIRSQQLGNAESGDVAKGGQGEEGVNEEGKWSSGSVELVVMAGETQPTFLAHPVPAPTNPIQCPPLILSTDPQ